MLYKTNTKAQLWTKIGNKDILTIVGAILSFTGQTEIIKERLCWEIESATNSAGDALAGYVGKFIEPKYLDPYTPDDPGGGTDPGSTPFTLQVDGFKPFSGALEPDA